MNLVVKESSRKRRKIDTSLAYDDDNVNMSDNNNDDVVDMSEVDGDDTVSQHEGRFTCVS